MWVKICGNTRVEDCLEAIALGADALGFIFAHGKRLVTAEHVRGITQQLPDSVSTFGVFTQDDPELILRTADAAGITGVQLHGEFNPLLLEALRLHFPAADRPRLLQVVHWWTDRSATEQAAVLRGQVQAITASGLVDAVLLDSRTQAGSGGTGVSFDWDTASASLDKLQIRLILAGGLRPENVAAGVAALRPWGVDVSSGVELSPGVKDAEKLRQFIANARL